MVDGEPSGPLEVLLSAVRSATYARDESGGIDAGYGIETEASGLPGEVIEAAGAAAEALAAIRTPLIRLGGRLEAVMADPPDWLDGQGRARIEGARFSLQWRVDLLAAWEAYPRSVKRGTLEWIKTAKTPPTRAARSRSCARSTIIRSS